MKEIWEDVPSLEGMYQASDRGRIRSVSRFTQVNKYFKKGRVLKPTTNNKSKYQSVRLCMGGKRNNVQIEVHTVVAWTFINRKNCDNDLCVNHKNFNRSDNRVENLEWITFKDNSKHAENRYRRKISLLEREDIRLWAKHFREINEPRLLVKIAKAYNISRRLVSQLAPKT